LESAQDVIKQAPASNVMPYKHCIGVHRAIGIFLRVFAVLSKLAPAHYD
jgi:hypothetical protein